MYVNVFFLLLLSGVSGFQQALNKNHQITLHVGSNPGLAIDFTVSLDTTIRLEIDDNITRASDTSVILDQIFLHDYVRYQNHVNVFTVLSSSPSNKNIISLAWLSAYVGCEVTLFMNTLFFCHIPKQISATKIKQELSLDHCFTNESIRVPTQSRLKNVSICLAADVNHVYVPSSLIKLDRTAQYCYTFETILQAEICSTDLINNKHILQVHDKNFILIGMNVLKRPFGITHTFGQQFVSPGWNEIPNYSAMDLVNIILVFCIFAIWVLFLKQARQVKISAPTTNQFVPSQTIPATIMLDSQLNVKSKPILYFFTIVFCYIIVYDILYRDLFFRLQYVTGDEYTENGRVYIIIATLALLLNVNLQIYSIYCRHKELQRSSFETLLAATLALFFVGRTTLAEENVITLLIALLWIFSQLHLLQQQHSGNVRRSQLLLFLIFLPFSILYFIDPFVRNIPIIAQTSITASVLLIVVPLTITSGYTTLSLMR